MTEEEFFNEKPKSNIVQMVLKRYFPFWPIYVFFTLIGLALAFVYLRSQTRVYVAKASVLLKDPNKSADAKVLEALNIFDDKKSVDNEILVLKSSSIIQQVVKDLDLYATMYNQGKVQVEELYKANAPLMFIAENKENITGGGKFDVDINWSKNTAKIGNKTVAFGSRFNINDSWYTLQANQEYNREAEGKKFFVVFNTPAGAAGSIIGSLRANAISYQSTVLDVTMETPIPARGMDILNRLFIVYNNASIFDKNQMAEQTLRFIDDRLDKIVSQLDSAEDRVERYRSANRITDIEMQSGQYSAAVAELETRKAQLDVQMDVLNDVQAYVSNKGSKKVMVPALGMIDGGSIGGLIGELNAANFELDKIRTTAGEQSEQVKLVRDKVRTLTSAINENLVNVRRNYNTERGNVEAKIAYNNGMLQAVPMKERTLLEMSRQQTIKNNIYTFFLQKKEETALSAAATSNDLRVLEAASFYGPIRPIPRNFYLAGLIGAFFAFLGYVLLMEQLSNKILFRSQIEDRAKVPVIAEIVQNKIKKVIAIGDGNRTVIAEQFRALRTNLGFLGFNDVNKVALVTSSISGEGKSFVATNLALSFTLTGKSVALVELDLRKPKLSKYLNVTRDPGISNYLVGKASIEDIIKKTSHENLSLVTAGVIPPNPSELLGSPEFGVLIDELKSRFDYVVIDSAPVGPVTDAVLVNKYIDHTLYVVRHGYTPINLMNLVDNLNKEKKFKKMNIVFNGIKPRGFHLFNYSFGGYGNGYGYGYGYGYTYGYGYGGKGGGGYYESGKNQPGYKNLFGFVDVIKNIFKKKTD